MKTFLEIITEYKIEIISGLCLLISVISLIVKRKPKSIEDFLYILDEVVIQLPRAISDVERPGDGLKKKNEVYEWAINRIASKLGRKLDNTELKMASSAILSQIESILSTPQKK